MFMTFDKKDKGKSFQVDDILLYWDHRANET